MWKRCQEWLTGEEGADLPDEDTLLSDLSAPRQKPLPNNDFMLESKKEMKERGIRSPDLADAIVLTFASNEYFPNYREPKPGAVFANLDAPQQTAVQQGPVFGGISPSGPHGWMG
jgi:hypothetical protein